MNNYLLSIDPSMKSTGFTLWENKIPILITSLNFSKKDYHYFTDFINIVFLQCQTNNLGLIDDKTDYSLYLVIERGIFNPKFGKGKETLDHLRGFIAGQFNKLLTKELSIELSQFMIKNHNWNIKIKDHDQAESLLIGWFI
ncbi:hypothetical protein [Spiroplasma endosymbiont of Nebria brevicollis]|uniref:hypothetical protein n=1 Tax=Spiroplasma endosymbiont of Nebria brevicollis TaxID=3066284 RepID=UPI00313A8599